ncbi:MAG: SDR family oxidoreductase [Bacteroidota bacterium]|nr:SDR family oxidoreductase [Bacteroidota bacterium]MDP3144703.1 SDR family oxidoreductase [Bacteroidota bacterium]
MNLDLKNKRAIVCGSTQGIGKAVAIELAALGANVTLIARNELALKQVKLELSNNGSQLHSYICADFNEPHKLKELVENFIQRSGFVNILVNNTGGPPAGPIINAKAEEFISAFNNHLVCNHLLTQACMEGMKQSGYGRVINIISTSVKQALPNLGVSNTIRAAVGNWAKTMANELGKFGITVNNVLPGATSTQRLTNIIENKALKTNSNNEEVKKEMLHEIPLGRFADASEVASAVAFLASPAAAYINGINLPVDGGRTSSL